MSDEAYLLNNATVIERIGQCISYGGAGSTASLSVGFYDDVAINKLKIAIKEASALTNKELIQLGNEVSDEIQKNGPLLNDNIKIIHKKFDEQIKSIDNITLFSKKNLFGLYSLVQYIIKRFPIFSTAVSGIFGIGKELLNIQLENMNYMREFVNSGVFFTNTYSDIHNFASEIGISSDTLVKALNQNSVHVARLQGLTGNGTGNLIKLFKAVKETGDEMGMNFSSSVKIADEVLKNSSIRLIESGNSFERLISQTEIYQKHLQRLSYITGKTVDNLIAENKIREDKVSLDIWASDPTNKMFYNILKQLGLSDSVIQTFANGGVPTEEFMKMYATSNASSEFLEIALNISKNLSNYKGDEGEKQLITDLLSAYPKEKAVQEWEFDKNNPIFVDNMAKSLGEGYTSGIKLRENALKMTQDDVLKMMKENTAPLEKQARIMSEITKIWEGFLNKLSVDANTIEKALSSIEIFFFRLEKSIKHLLDGNFASAYDALIKTSPEEYEFIKKRNEDRENNLKRENEKNQKELKNLSKKKELTEDEEKRKKELEKNITENNLKIVALQEETANKLKNVKDTINNEKNQLQGSGTTEKVFYSTIDTIAHPFGDDASIVMLKEIDEGEKTNGLFLKLDKRLEQIIDNSYIKEDFMTGEDNRNNFEKSMDKLEHNWDYQRRYFLAMHGEEILSMKNQVDEMKLLKNNSTLSEEQIKKIVDEYTKNNKLYNYNDDEKNILTGILNVLQDIKYNTNDNVKVNPGSYE